MTTTTNKGRAYIRRYRSAVVVFGRWNPRGAGLDITVVSNMGTQSAFRKGLSRSA